MALLATAQGTSVITEKIYENRMQHVAELQRMGASIRVQGNSAGGRCALLERSPQGTTSEPQQQWCWRALWPRAKHR